MIVMKGRVIACRDASVIEKGIVAVEGNRIVASCPEWQFSVPDWAEVLEVEDGTIMPGMVEQHCHIGNSGKPSSLDFYMTNPYEETVYMLEELEELLMAGFTSIRDVGGTAHLLKKAWKAGNVLGPRIFASGRLISSTGGHGDELQRFPASFSKTGLSGVCILDGVDECRRGARLLFREGADFLKVCTTGGIMSEGDLPENADYSLSELCVFVEEAELKNTYVAAHAEGRLGIYNALMAGVRCIEHGTCLDDVCLEMMSDQETWFVPTLSTMWLLAQMKDRLSPWVREKVDGVYEKHCNAARRAYGAGIKIGVGTDFIYDRSIMPYGRNAMELELLLGIGMKPIEVLQAATKTGSELTLKSDVLGTLEEGKLADILLVRGNPLKDVTLLQDARRIEAVLLDGTIVKRPRPFSECLI